MMSISGGSSVVKDQKIVYRQTGDLFIVRLTPYKPWPLLLFLSVWLVPWTSGGYWTFRGLITGKYKISIFLIIWLVFWLCGDMLVVSYVFWTMLGRELIKLKFTEHTLETRGEILGLGIGRKFQMQDVSNLRISDDSDDDEPSPSSVPQKFKDRWSGFGNIVFDYQGRKFSFGVNLNKAQSREVIDKLSQYFR